jgi:hypothetical protein
MMTNKDKMLLFVRDALLSEGISSEKSVLLAQKICAALIINKVVLVDESSLREKEDGILMS